MQIYEPFVMEKRKRLTFATTPSIFKAEICLTGASLLKPLLLTDSSPTCSLLSAM